MRNFVEAGHEIWQSEGAENGRLGAAIPGDFEMAALSKRERSFIVNSLRRLREHYKAFSGYEGAELQLIGFALYEGSYKDAASGRIIAETAPFALGQELVDHYGFEWVIVTKPFEVATYAVKHATNS